MLGPAVTVHDCPDGVPIAVLAGGDGVLATGRTEDGLWIEIRSPLDTTLPAWMSAGTLDPDGDLADLPVHECGVEGTTTTTGSTTTVPGATTTTSTSPPRARRCRASRTTVPPTTRPRRHDHAAADDDAAPAGHRHRRIGVGRRRQHHDRAARTVAPVRGDRSPMTAHDHRPGDGQPPGSGRDDDVPHDLHGNDVFSRRSLNVFGSD